MSTASTTHKKQHGTLSVTDDRQKLVWSPAGDAPPTVNIAVAEITNIQQTPATSEKVSIRVFVQTPSTPAPETHTFAFNAPGKARDEQVAITDTLRKAIEAFNAQKNAAPAAAPVSDGSGQSAAMAIAQAVSAGSKALETQSDDATLLNNIELQRSLLNAQHVLRQRFNESLAQKPENITVTQFQKQFWSTRIHLLRAHQVEKSQHQGTYNVLAVVKPELVDGKPRLMLSKEQIQLIFSLHPVVKHAYNENVPQMSEGEFWSRFFASRLVKKLKGEKVQESDPTDVKFDRYLTWKEQDLHAEAVDHVPHFIDLEGNEQNHSQKRGNRPDQWMRPKDEPIMKVLNNLSEKLLADVTPADIEAHAPVGMDEETFKHLQLRDLERNSLDNRVMLNIRDRSKFSQGMSNKAEVSEEAAAYAKQPPKAALAAFVKSSASRRHLQNGTNGAAAEAFRSTRQVVIDRRERAVTDRLDSSLEEEIGVQSDSDSDDEDEPKQPRVGSRSSRADATMQISEAIQARRTQTDDFSSLPGTFAIVDAQAVGLTDELYQELLMTQNTTIEFLHYFWIVFLSGDADRAQEVQMMVETLNNSLNRMNAVADRAEAKRAEELTARKKLLDDELKRTGRRVRAADQFAGIGGGRSVVNDLMLPTRRAIKAATDRFRSAYEAQVQATQSQKDV